MTFLMILGVIIASLFLIAGTTACTAKKKGDENISAPKSSVTAKQIKSMSKAEVEEMLKRVESRKAPEPKMGAMCYEVAAPPERAEYVCPICAEKTIYDKDQTAFIVWELQACRREFKLLKKTAKLKLSMDESSFCKHCKPDAREQQLRLVVTYADGTEHSVAPIDGHDLSLLNSFLKGDLLYTSYNDDQSPIKKQLPRLKALLGVGLTGAD